MRSQSRGMKVWLYQCTKEAINVTDNYRGIVISSCVEKIYLKVLTMRIENHMASSGLWKFNQCGFKKDHRTEDNLFVLNTVYESHVVNKNEKSYVAFVDFTKYFDLINRNFLLYKLLKYGITGPIYYVIKSMYSATKYSVRIHDKKSQFPCQHLVSHRAAQWAQYCLIYTKMICMISSMAHAITLKTKAMVLTKQRYKTERFVNNGTLLKCVKLFGIWDFT